MLIQIKLIPTLLSKANKNVYNSKKKRNNEKKQKQKQSILIPYTIQNR